MNVATYTNTSMHAYKLVTSLNTWQSSFWNPIMYAQMSAQQVSSNHLGKSSIIGWMFTVHIAVFYAADILRFPFCRLAITPIKILQSHCNRKLRSGKEGTPLQSVKCLTFSFFLSFTTADNICGVVIQWEFDRIPQRWSFVVPIFFPLLVVRYMARIKGK